MEELASVLLSSSEVDTRVGFHGMGGGKQTHPSKFRTKFRAFFICGSSFSVGKTTISAWLVRRNDIRNKFTGAICWVTLGQAPNILKLQQLLYLQLTGTGEI